MCRSHYSSTNKSSTVMNESITVSTTTVFVTKSGTLTTDLGNAMEIDIVIGTVMKFVGMGNWEQVHTFATVCKCWRHSSLPQMLETFIFASSVQYWESSNGWQRGT
jgi:hypothetical protein